MYYIFAVLIVLISGCAHIQRDIYDNTPEFSYVETVEINDPTPRSVDEWNSHPRITSSDNTPDTPIPNPPLSPARTVDPFPEIDPFRNLTLPDSLRHFIRIGLSINKSSHTVDSPHTLYILSLENGTWKKVLKVRGTSRIEQSGDQLKLKAGGKTYTFPEALQLVSTQPDIPIKIDNHDSFRGHFEVRKNSTNLTLINEIYIEEYLRGVLPYEMGKRKTPHYESLKAQAVAARTYTYKHLGSRNSFHFDLYADVRDQMYRGTTAEYPLSDSAIQSTEGLVLTWNNELVDAFYHSTCGGETANIHEVWPNAQRTPYLVAMSDTDPNGNPWCSQSSFLSWSVSWEKQDLVKFCNTNLRRINPSMSEFTDLERLEIMGWTTSGRVSELSITTDQGVHTIPSDKSRWILRRPENGNILMSSKYKLYKNGSVYTAKGRGFGHGIGLCQMGAMSRSSSGQTFEEILKAYYKDTEVVRFK